MKEIVKNVYHVGDSGCSVFLIDTQSEDGLVLIDCGMSLNMIKKISKHDLNPMEIRHCIITHYHIDHIAACADLKNFNKRVKFYSHELDADAIEEPGHDRETAANWYGVKYTPIKLERKLKGDYTVLNFGSYSFECIHIPGHTPGSIAIMLKLKDPNVNAQERKEIREVISRIKEVVQLPKTGLVQQLKQTPLFGFRIAGKPV